jgi:phosphoglycolate phosphatase
MKISLRDVSLIKFKSQDIKGKTMRAYKTVLFDIDGTVFSSEDIIGKTYEKEFRIYLEELGREETPPDMISIMTQIGKPIVEIFQNLAPFLEADQQRELSGRILQGLIKAIREGGGHFYPGVVDVIKTLHGRGYRLYTASNGAAPYIEAILDYGNLLPLFSGLPVLDNVEINDKAELVAHILQLDNILPEEALMVGDRASDRDAGVKNNVPFAACLYGHGSSEEWEGAVSFLNSPSDLLEILP